jgi:serine O-acetyltransferase
MASTFLHSEMKMEMSLTVSELKSYLSHQLENFFPDGHLFVGSDIERALKLALDRTEWCFKHITLPGYSSGGEARFSHLHSDQYSQFLYFLSNSLWKDSQNKPICDKLIFLNKTLNGMFYSYKGRLPDIFLFGHPVGSIIGNAEYSDFLVIFQNVTINTDAGPNGEVAPQLGKGVFLAAGAKIIGNKRIGDRVSIGVDTVIFNKEVESDSVAFTKDGIVTITKRNKECKAQSFFNVPIE